MLERLQLKNFTVFDDLDMRFSPGVNLLIGHNGTGKTHILKILYTALSALLGDKRVRVSDKIANIFLPDDRRIGRLVKRTKGSSTAKIIITKNKEILRLRFDNHIKETLKLTNKWNKNSKETSIYIPVKEMLANAPGFLSLYYDRGIHFEEVYADILHKAFLPQLRGPISKERKELLEIIQHIISGKVVLKNDQFFLKNKEGNLEFTLLAEGMRKLALLWLLIQNGALLEGAKLFWDEPEANLNPSMLNKLVEILLRLQQNGVQIFIATHNYVLLKQFDLQRTSKDKIRFFSLSKERDSSKIVCVDGENYLDIVPNKISEAYTEIYDGEVRRNLGGSVA